MARPRFVSNLPTHTSLRVGRMRQATHEGAASVVHPHASLALYLEGSARVWCGAAYDVRAGDLLLVPEGMPHYTESSEEAEILGLSLCASCMASSSAGAHLLEAFAEVSKGGSASRRLTAKAARQITWALESLEDELATRAAWDALAIEGHLGVLAALVRRTSSAARSVGEAAASRSVVGDALTFITSRANEGISLADVARHVHLSKAHTAARVKAETGLTVVAWITHARLANARQLLLHTDDTVEAIAGRVGFASASHFHRTFRREVGATPAAWRAAHREAR
jgi:AraC-like DNA-binding protein